MDSNNNEYYYDSNEVDCLRCISANKDCFLNFNNRDSSLFLMGINIQSIHSKYDRLKEMLASLDLKYKCPEVIGFQELYMSDNMPPPNFNNYHPLVFANRTSSRGGGVGLLIKKNNLSYNKNE